MDPIPLEPAVYPPPEWGQIDLASVSIPLHRYPAQPQFTFKSGKPSSVIEAKRVLAVSVVQENPNPVKSSQCLQAL